MMTATHEPQDVKLLHCTAEFLLFEMLYMKLELAQLKRSSPAETEQALSALFQRMLKIFPAEREHELRQMVQTFLRLEQPQPA